MIVTATQCKQWIQSAAHFQENIIMNIRIYANQHLMQCEKTAQLLLLNTRISNNVKKWSSQWPACMLKVNITQSCNLWHFWDKKFYQMLHSMRTFPISSIHFWATSLHGTGIWAIFTVLSCKNGDMITNWIARPCWSQLIVELYQYTVNSPLKMLCLLKTDCFLLIHHCKRTPKYT